MRAIDITGERYGRLVVKKFSGSRRTVTGQSIRTWECVCDCGNITVVDLGSLRGGNTSSCGCLSSETKTSHGLHKDRFYRIWVDMKVRCNCETSKSYHLYGGKGISYDPRWEDFLEFKKDMEDGYASNLTLDRVDPSGNYCKDNCRWITKTMQTRNKGVDSRNKTGVTGVHEWTDRKSGTMYYVASCRNHITGKIMSKHFSINRYGDELAFFAACEFRDVMIQRLNLLGAGYTENHGK